MISGIVRAILCDAEKDKLMQELQNSCNNKYTPMSENAKKENPVTVEYKRI